MKRRAKGTASKCPKKAFTLVEMLIVVVIIAILVGLATPALISALASVKEKTKLIELNMIAQGIESYRIEYGEYPPDFTDAQQVLDHLNRIFPRRVEFSRLTDIVELIDRKNMNPSTALTFWLRGFYPHPEYPITGDLNQNNVEDDGMDRESIIQLDSKLISRLAYNGDGDLYTHGDEVLAPSGKPDVPFIYFDHRTCVGCDVSYERSTGEPKWFNLQTGNYGAGKSASLPYSGSGKGSAVAYMSSETNKYANPDTFQLLCAGRDGHFGEFNKSNPLKWFGTGKNFHPDGYDHDNLTNFSTTNLGDAIE